METKKAGGSSPPPPKTDWTPGAYFECPHTATRQVILPKGSFLHYGRVECAKCGQWLGWLPKPENALRQHLNKLKLERLGRFPGLTSYEKHFLTGMKAKQHLSPKQQALLDRIYGHFLEETRT